MSTHSFFFFNDTATTEIYTLSLHDALPIFNTFLFGVIILIANILKRAFSSQLAAKLRNRLKDIRDRSEERFSRNAETDLVCRLLLEKKKDHQRPPKSAECRAEPGDGCDPVG